MPAQTRAGLPPLFMISTVTGGRRSVAVGGELDLTTAPLLHNAVAEAFRTGSAGRGTTTGRFVLDLSGVSFMDGSALTALDRIGRSVRRRGEELSVVAPVARGPRRLLLLAVGRGWLSPAFSPVHPGEADGGGGPHRPERGEAQVSSAGAAIDQGFRLSGRIE